MWAEHTAAMEPALGRHDDLLRAAIDARDGYVFSIAGDSFGAAFAQRRGCGCRRGRRAGRAARGTVDGSPGRPARAHGPASWHRAGARGQLLRARGEPGRAASCRPRGAARSCAPTRSSRAARRRSQATTVSRGSITWAHQLRDVDGTVALHQVNGARPPRRLPAPAHPRCRADDDPGATLELRRPRRRHRGGAPPPAGSPPRHVDRTRGHRQDPARDRDRGPGAAAPSGRRVLRRSRVARERRPPRRDSRAGRVSSRSTRAARRSINSPTRCAARDVLLVLDNCEHVLDAAAELVDRVARGVS